MNYKDPMPYRKWYASEISSELKWLFPTIASLAYMLRMKKKALLELGLIEAIPTRGYFIYPEKFTVNAIKPLFFGGSHE